MDKLEQIIEHYIDNQEEKNAENVAFLQENVVGKSSDEIATLLSNVIPEETGGLLQFRGFIINS